MKKILIALTLIILSSCTSDVSGLKFSKENYTGQWPFSVIEIEVYCSGYKEVYCKADNGKIYALNGSAKTAALKNSDISDIQEIWLDNPEFPEYKIPYNEFIEEGLKICEHK